MTGGLLPATNTHPIVRGGVFGVCVCGGGGSEGVISQGECY